MPTTLQKYKQTKSTNQINKPNQQTKSTNQTNKPTNQTNKPNQQTKPTNQTKNKIKLINIPNH